MAIFRLDKDQFLRQLNELKQAGDEYEAAKQELSVAVDQAALGINNAQGASSQYSALKELQQFGRPAHVSLVTLDEEMANLSLDQEETIEDLRWSVRRRPACRPSRSRAPGRWAAAWRGR